jgi:hypothetical protein
MLHQFYMRSPNVPHAFLWGFLELKTLQPLHGMNAVLTCSTKEDKVAVWVYGISEQGAIIWSVRTSMFRLPGGQAEFEKEIAGRRVKKTGFPLPGNKEFEPALLAPPTVPATWDHAAFQTCGDEHRTIIHEYAGGHHAMYIQYMLPRDAILDHPMFQWFTENFQIKEDVWHIQLPSESRTTRPVKETTDEPLGVDIRQEIAASVARACAYLQLPPGQKSPEAAQQAIFEAVQRVIGSTKTLPPKAVQDMAIELGSLWGQSICDALGWEWCCVKQEEGKVFAVASVDRSHYVAPMHFLQRQLEQRGETADNTTLLLFNMIKAGETPPANAREYQMLN